VPKCPTYRSASLGRQCGGVSEGSSRLIDQPRDNVNEMRGFALIALVGCGGATVRTGTVVALRDACKSGQYWNGKACASPGDGADKVATGAKALAELHVDDAKAALDAAEQAGPLDHARNVQLWEQRGIAAAYLDDEASAKTAFAMMLALDPSHVLSYTLSPNATFVFEQVRKATTDAPAIDITWPRGGKVGDPVPLDVDVVADPKKFLRRATVFVRARGDAGWHAADLVLARPEQRIVLPATAATRPVSLELYLRAYDDRGNEVLTWADPARPREIALRYDPPSPWYRTWWAIAIAGSAVAAGTGLAVYELTLAPPDKVGGSATVITH